MNGELRCPFCDGGVMVTMNEEIMCVGECGTEWSALGEPKRQPANRRIFGTARAVDPVTPRQAIGYDVANAVGALFQTLRRDGVDVDRLLIPTIRVSYDAGIVRASAVITGSPGHRYACGCNGQPHWGPEQCNG